MKNFSSNSTSFYLIFLSRYLLLTFCGRAQQQQPLQKRPVSKAIKIFSTPENQDVFGVSKSFIENKGQYGTTLKGFDQMGKIKYGYEGFAMPVLFTDKGLILMHRKLRGPSKEELEREEKKGKRENEEWEHQKARDKKITMEWLNASPNVEIVSEEMTTAYHTYGFLQERAKGFKKIIYKNLYTNIDVVFFFRDDALNGFEYNIVLKPGADINDIKMKFGGQLKKLQLDASGQLSIHSAIGMATHTSPIGYYENDTASKRVVSFIKDDNIISFQAANSIDNKKQFIIDPFLTIPTTLTGTNSNTAKDIDFDYTGNVYVTGGGDTTSHKLAKYNAAGVLQWTFSGALTAPSWTFGTYYGGWAVDKTNGSVYLGQGAVMSGFKVIRLNTLGLYDNYISNANPDFQENWKMVWNCNNGSPQLFIGGGGTSSNYNLGFCSPPSTTIIASNITGITTTGGHQDISDVLVDPVTNSMYTIFASSLSATNGLSNRIYKHNPPYNVGSAAWNTQSGFFTMYEAQNRPTLYAYSFSNDNSSNLLAVNSNYLFYWDGRNLKAFNKATGAAVGSSLALNGIGYFSMDHQGIVADECNTVFVGGRYGVINVFKFNGTGFDDAPPDIIFSAGSSFREIHDLAFDETKGLLYACGIGFVAAFDVSSHCPTNIYKLNVTTSCTTASTTATVTGNIPSGTQTNYTLYNGSTIVASNTTGLFTSLVSGVNYTITANVNLPCRVVTLSQQVSIAGPTVSVAVTNTACSAASGSITVSASGSVAPYTYSINGTTFQPSNLFTSLAAGNYTIIVKDANGCIGTATVTVATANGPTVSTAQTNTTCGNSNGIITVNGSGGTGALTYSINNGLYQANNVFTGLAAGVYTIIVKDATNCIATATITLTNLSSAPVLTTNVLATTCALANGIITLTANGGSGAYTYTLNSGPTQTSNNFSSLAAGSYNVAVLDANNCITTAIVNVQSSVAPVVAATVSNTTCGGSNGIITATGSAGSGTFTYALNNGTFQTANTFTSLAAATYTLTVKDAANCTASTSVIIAPSTPAPTITLSTTSATCSSANGTITATATGGTNPLQYSINSSTPQSNNVFQNLAAGNYVVAVTDAGNCTTTSNISVINASTAPTLTLSSAASTCGSNNGSIIANATGGSLPYQYTVNGNTYQAANQFSNLAAGNYTVTVKDANGCTNTATITVAFSSSITVQAGSDTAVCEGRSIALSGVTNAATYSWSPAVGLSNPASLQPIASPAVSTSYILTATNGTCTVSDTVVIIVKPAPVATAGPDTTICFGKSVQLSGQGGASYQWMPATYLNNPGVANPISVRPANSISYTLTTVGSNGCSSLQRDTLKITVIPAPQVFAGNDTAISINQTLPLNAIDVNGTGFSSYLWTPAYRLNNTTIKNPVTSTDIDIEYTVLARTQEGCEGTDALKVKVFKTIDVFVPNAFTPNGDGKNDLLKPILIGMKQLLRFTLYNRYGQIIYNTQTNGTGWDGKLNSVLQATGTYIWTAEAVDYLNKVHYLKGTSILIR